MINLYKGNQYGKKWWVYWVGYWSDSPEVHYSIDVVGNSPSSHLCHFDWVQMVSFSWSLVVDTLIGLDIFGEVGNCPLLHFLGVGLLIGREVCFEGVFACMRRELPFLMNLATFLLKPPRISSLLVLIYPERKGRPFHCTSSSPTTTCPSAMSYTFRWLVWGSTNNEAPPFSKLT